VGFRGLLWDKLYLYPEYGRAIETCKYVMNTLHYTHLLLLVMLCTLSYRFKARTWNKLELVSEWENRRFVPKFRSKERLRYLETFQSIRRGSRNYVLLTTQFDGSRFPQHTWLVRSALYLLLIDPYLVMFVIIHMKHKNTGNVRITYTACVRVTTVVVEKR